MRVSVVVPTWNGLSLLQAHLPTLLRAEGIEDAQLIVVDDGSTDGTAQWLRENVPQAEVIRLERNGGFARACNAGIAAATGDALLLLNNDVEVAPDFLPPLLRALASAPDVFAVNARILLPGKSMQDEGRKRGRFHHGLFYVDTAPTTTETTPTLYATACAALYQREWVNQLGGFDEGYSPCYWEDVDLSYRALRRGGRVLYEPKSVVWHAHQATTARLPVRFLRRVRERNRFLFAWQNVLDPRWMAAGLLLAPFVALWHLLRGGDLSVLLGWEDALRRWPQIAARRARERREVTVSDRDVLARFGATSLPAPTSVLGYDGSGRAKGGTGEEGASSPSLHPRIGAGGRSAAPLRLLVVSAWCPFPPDNGSRLRAFHLVRELARQGHSLTLIALGQTDTDADAACAALRPLCAGGVQIVPSRFFRPGTLRAALGFVSPRPRSVWDTWQPAAARAVAQACGSGAHDAVLVLELGAAHYLPARCPLPAVLDQVETSSVVRPVKEARGWKRLRLRLMLAKHRAHLRALAPRYALWTAVSEAERQAVTEFVGARRVPPIHIVPNGVDLEWATPAPDGTHDPDTLVYPGALSFDANADAVRFFVADILPRIQQERPQARLLVTGLNDALVPGDPLRRAPGVTLTGYLDDVRPAVRGAAVCVAPLRQGGGTRLKVLEAMALGTPVVATTRGAEGIDAAPGEHLLVADTPAAFADACLRVMADPLLRASLSRNGRRLTEARYGWHAIAAHLSELLEALPCP